MNIVYYVGNETAHGIEKISPEFPDSLEALIELESLRDDFPKARICEEYYCSDRGYDWVQ